MKVTKPGIQWLCFQQPKSTLSPNSRSFDNWGNISTFQLGRRNMLKQSRDTSNIATKWRPTSYFYCDKFGHQPKKCAEVPIIEQRLQIMKTKKLS
ncbi:hypothetical protein Y032_0112g311 [Ancylostoma ceylanicum]|uniref:CCHC-type domain-containing protein n=1 Tax=Ancylostoma ceylanicum TaxID=53326 RepID=A0A016TDU7_9BILA|nr:hypothetical protein Y032_0112g311 [Ancylostoma ceylanicum]